MNLELINKYLDEIREMNLGNKAEKALSHSNFERLNSLQYKLETHNEVLTHYEKKVEGLDGLMKDIVKIVNMKNVNQALAQVPLKAGEVKKFMKEVRKEIASFNKEQKKEKKQESKQSWRQNNRIKYVKLKTLQDQLRARGQLTHDIDKEIEVRAQYVGPGLDNKKEERRAKKAFEKSLRKLPKGTNDIKLLEKREDKQNLQQEQRQDQGKEKSQTPKNTYDKAKEKLQPLIKKKSKKKELELDINY